MLLVHVIPGLRVGLALNEGGVAAVALSLNPVGLQRLLALKRIRVHSPLLLEPVQLAATIHGCLRGQRFADLDVVLEQGPVQNAGCIRGLVDEQGKRGRIIGALLPHHRLQMLADLDTCLVLASEVDAVVLYTAETMEDVLLIVLLQYDHALRVALHEEPVQDAGHIVALRGC